MESDPSVGQDEKSMAGLCLGCTIVIIQSEIRTIEIKKREYAGIK